MRILQRCQTPRIGFALIGQNINYQINPKTNQSLLLNCKIAIAEEYKITKTNINDIQKSVNLNT